MPLLTSPIDGSPMKPIHRFGIEIDVCPTSGGIWLDKGELEKLLSFIKQAAEEENALYNTPKHHPSEHHLRGRHDDDDYDSHRKPFKKKKSGLSQIMDVFDF
ncbi:MAG: zf-TFIIB domain-containing protein [Alphaproteobacteria bacterium]